jgi:C4-dicarboxylate transporter, DctM subunit
MITVLFVSVCIFFAIGIPISFAVGLASLLAILYNGTIPLMMFVQKLAVGTDSFSLLAIPFFVLAGDLMNMGGITRRLIKFAGTLVGHIPGGLAMVNVITSMIFGGISGSAISDTATVGSILIPAMHKQGYDMPFSVGLTAATSVIAPLIPPSIPFVIYGLVAEVSIGKLFLAGAVPGILMGLFFLVTVYFLAIRRNYPKNEKRATVWEIIVAFYQALPALFMPIIILGGILSGMFTPTEASAVAVVYAIIIGTFVYRELTWTSFTTILLTSARISAIIMLIVGCANVFAWLLAFERIPLKIGTLIFAFTQDPMVYMFLINIVFLVVGMFMGATEAIIIFTPIFLPIAKSMGLDPVYFGAVMVLNLMIGLLTPPVCACLSLAAKIGRITLDEAFKAVIPMLIVDIFLLGLVTYIPAISLWLPKIFFG